MTPAKKTMTLNLADAEMTALHHLAAEKDITKTALIRQALRLYQLLDVRTKAGERLFFEDEKSKEKKEVVVL